MHPDVALQRVRCLAHRDVGLPAALTARVLVRLAALAARYGRHGTAVAAYDAALDRDRVPSWIERRDRSIRRLPAPRRHVLAEVWQRRARDHLDAGRLLDAERDLRAAIAADDADPVLHEDLAEILDRRGARREAGVVLAASFARRDDVTDLERRLLAVKPGFFRSRRQQAELVDAELPRLRARAGELAARVTPADPPPVFVYWGQGEAHAPATVRRCLTELRRWVPGEQLVVLDDDALPRWIDVPDQVARIADRHRTQYADYVRCALLHRHGGVWVDATVLVTAPLGPFVEPLLPAGFFAFRYGGVTSPTIASWFLAAAPGNRTVGRLLAALERTWQLHDRPPHYFFFHHLFEALVHLDDEVHEDWLRTPRADGDPVALLRAMHEPFDAAAAARALAGSPVHKLSYKQAPGRIAPEPTLELLGALATTAWPPTTGAATVQRPPSAEATAVFRR